MAVVASAIVFITNVDPGVDGGCGGLGQPFRGAGASRDGRCGLAGKFGADDT